MNIFANHKPIEVLNTNSDLHSYRYIGEEMEGLGARLDSARSALAQAKSAWACWYWQETVNRLLTQWRALPILRDGQAQHTLISRWSIDYEFWENREEVGYIGIESVADKIFDDLFRNENLEDSWHRVRDERIMKCNCQ